MSLVRNMKPLINCLINGTSYKESGKSISIEGDRNEQILFFKIDGCYIDSSSSRKCDLLVIYSDSEWRFIILVELKGKKIKDAIEQFEQTINNPRFRYIFDKNSCNSCDKNKKCRRVFVIVHGGGISCGTDLKGKIKKKYGFYLELVSNSCNLREIIRRYKK